ncbi:hypothetical protein N9T42_02370 [SAR86 cluster bacterium]|jgi:hypothetical protein|nr:hypothetical protein [SAR86 cluster bacterium]
MLSERINRDTGQFFKRGDKRLLTDIQDGRLFWTYVEQEFDLGSNEKGEIWYTYTEFHDALAIEKIPLKKSSPWEMK